ncbi:MAG: hypothetical protein LBE17_11250 [Treponema sp.]|nr:hypothetical protein [Treponema sp.]
MRGRAEPQGTVANLLAAATAAYVAALSGVPESGKREDAGEYLAGQGGGIDGGATWPLNAPSGSPASRWFAGRVYGGAEGGRCFVTTAASGAAAAPLDISTMAEVSMDAPPADGNEPAAPEEHAG